MWELATSAEALIFLGVVGAFLGFTKYKTGRWPWQKGE